MSGYLKTDIPLKKDLETIQQGSNDDEQQTRFMNIKKGCMEYFQEFCTNTSLHGLQYVGNQSRTWIERLIWIALFLTSIVFCTILINQAYNKWQSTPVIVSFAENPTPIWEVPFPAVTICPQTKSKQTIYNFTEYFHKFSKKHHTQEELENFSMLTLVCDMLDLQEYKWKDYYDESILEFLLQATPNIDDIFDHCTFHHAEYPCSELFFPTLNEDGICYTFNMLRADEIFTKEVFLSKKFYSHGPRSNGWSIEKGYLTNANLFTYPRRLACSGINSGLELVVKVQKEDIDYICKGPVQGFKVILHEPGAIARGRTQYFRVPIDEEVIVAALPSMMTTSDNLKSYDPAKRMCYFQEEMKVRYFKRYTYQNCELECITNATLNRCGCVPYYMPRDKTTPICGPGKLKCVQDVKEGMLVKMYDSSKMSHVYHPPCNCLPPCFSLNYNSEVTQAPFEWRKLHNALNKPMRLTPGETIDSLHLSRIRIFYKDIQFITTRRQELFGGTDFVANCGGIFGLFTGFSLLSLMEIIYYVTVRMWINKKKFGKFLIATPSTSDACKHDKHDHY